MYSCGMRLKDDATNLVEQWSRSRGRFVWRTEDRGGGWWVDVDDEDDESDSDSDSYDGGGDSGRVEIVGATARQPVFTLECHHCSLEHARAVELGVLCESRTSVRGDLGSLGCQRRCRRHPPRLDAGVNKDGHVWARAPVTPLVSARGGRLRRAACRYRSEVCRAGRRHCSAMTTTATRRRRGNIGGGGDSDSRKRHRSTDVAVSARRYRR